MEPGSGAVARARVRWFAAGDAGGLSVKTCGAGRVLDNLKHESMRHAAGSLSSASFPALGLPESSVMARKALEAQKRLIIGDVRCLNVYPGVYVHIVPQFLKLIWRTGCSF